MHMLAPNIVIVLTFDRFEAGQNLFRSRSNYFAHDGQARAFLKSTGKSVGFFRRWFNITHSGIV